MPPTSSAAGAYDGRAGKPSAAFVTRVGTVDTAYIAPAMGALRGLHGGYLAAGEGQGFPMAVDRGAASTAGGKIGECING